MFTMLKTADSLTCTCAIFIFNGLVLKWSMYGPRFISLVLVVGKTCLKRVAARTHSTCLTGFILDFLTTACVSDSGRIRLVFTSSGGRTRILSREPATSVSGDSTNISTRVWVLESRQNKLHNSKQVMFHGSDLTVHTWYDWETPDT